MSNYPSDQRPVKCAGPDCNSTDFVLTTRWKHGLWECETCGDGAEPISARPAGCPTAPVTGIPDNEQILGCGGTNLQWDGREAWDCLDCGMFITLDYLDYTAV